MKIIGLSGKAGCGKTTTAIALRYIMESLDVEIVSFADVLREEVAHHLGIDPRMLRYGKDTIVTVGAKSISIREVLQWWGTEVRRAADPLYWVNRFIDRVRPLTADIVIVDDVRFLDEATCIKCAGQWLDGAQGYLFRIEPYDGYTSGDVHPSETGLDNYLGFDRRYSPKFGGLVDLAHEIFEVVK